jgi:hypothetical protein
MTLYFYLAKITPRAIRKPKSDFVQKCLPLVPVPSQLNPIEILQVMPLLCITFMLILSMRRSLKICVPFIISE